MPMEFGALLERSVESAELKSAIRELMEKKQAGLELDTGPRIEIISDFIESELRRLEDELSVGVRDKPASEKLDEFFRFAIESI